MPLLVNSVPNLAQGVSQQPDTLRYPGQCDEQINAWSTVVEGLKKRPNTEYVKNIDSTSTESNLFTHFVKRDETNQYMFTVSLGGVGAIDLTDGTKISVATTSIASSYLSLGGSSLASSEAVSNPLSDLRAMTVADYTFLVNKKRTVQIDPNLTTKDLEYEALVFVQLGDYEKNYDIYLENTLVPYSSTGVQSDQTPATGHTYESGDSSGSKGGEYADTALIAEDLETILNNYLPSTQGISSGTLSGGSGFPDSGRQKDVGWQQLDYSYEFFIDQYQTSSHTTQIGFGAKGTCVFKNGSIQSSTLTHRGIGYDNTLAADTLKLTIRAHRVQFFPATPASAGTRAKKERTETEKFDYTSASPGKTMPSIVSPVFVTSSFTVTRNGSIIKISSTSDFSLRTEDGLSNQALKVAYKEVNSITDLPAHCFNDFRIKVRGDADISQDDYYVKFQTKDKEDFGEGSWVEVAGWESNPESAAAYKGIETTLDAKTLPVTLVPRFNADGEIFKFSLEAPGESSNIVLNDSTFYNLVKNHTSTDATEPGTGADWQEYWIETTVVDNAPLWSNNFRYFKSNVGHNSRTAGDDFTNPFPTFTNNTINDVFFFKNRLGFVTDSSVIFSEADEYFNFFRTTTQQLLDSAPIDVGLSHTKVAILQHAIPFQEKLILFSKQSQFVLRGADVLSPKTVAISPVTEYDISDSVEPIALGNYIYFTFKRNDFEGMYEYFVDNNTEVFDAEEVTQQIPKYIPNNVRKIAGSQAENTLIVGVDSDLKTLYVYKYFWSNREKVQSAWMKFSFDRDVVGFDFIDSKLYMVTKDTEGLHLEYLTLEDGLTDEGLDYSLLLDSRVDGSDVTVSVYNPTTKKTRISNIPYNVSLGTDIELYTKIGTQRAITMVDDTTVDVTGTIASYVTYDGTIYKCETTHTAPSSFVAVDTSVTPNVTYWSVSTDVTSAPAWSSGNFYNNDQYFFIGKPYDMLYRFSDQSLKQPTERGGRSASDYTFQTIRNGSINYADTGHFTVEVTPEYRDTYSYVFNPDIVGADLLLNEFKPQSGHFRFAVQARPNEVKIEVKSASALPCKLLAAEFESLFVPRSRRYGS